ncbi:OsmC family protein [Rudaeicoccus suwonensis]|uniref:Organic hydroperoxide reductase OsmC/OhrA n=1 Tax=Rudaeicoccus suwonensis TaxID=657409 RepID=A0A561E3K6_9MICO|nr:OsmC family protein [Rudaeicoccus suwonensis]TWE10196.1 organic hydroperoxide reductase OsmC/OhrA [Rudaeicoccus suwonensis]
MSVHRYDVGLAWSGTTSVGYDAYSREHQVFPAELDPVQVSADPHFRGDPARLNPEQLLVMAAASCQLLSFLAVASRARLDVLDYRDSAVGSMPEAKGAMSVTRIELRPTIVLAPGSRLDRLDRLVHLAHEQCYIANSLRSEVVIDADFRIDDRHVAHITVG